MSRERNSGVVLGLLAGAAIGSLLGVLFAPEKGDKLRRRVRNTAEDLRDDALDTYENLAEIAKKEVNKVISNVKHGYDKYKSDVQDAASELKK